MQLDPLNIQVIPRLVNTGSADQTQGVLPLANIAVGHRQFGVLGGISFDANLLNTSEAILLNGTATACLTTCCDRCLENTQLSITGELQGYYLFEPLATQDEELEVYEMVDAKGYIDIAPSILAAIVHELPPVTLCAQDCKGITILSTDDASHDNSVQEKGEAGKVNPLSPFAALKDFKIDE
ncbi:MAG: DUF177 domain-containing protein [Coriobacteriia bacterium]|nr:DUF177 domain-containing protein [Coriobacteriia bacterium]